MPSWDGSTPSSGPADPRPKPESPFSSEQIARIVPLGLATKSAIKTAKDVLDRFYRDAEGRTNRQIDVYFTLEDMQLGKERSEAAIEYLVSRGLVNSFGSDIAYLTEAGLQAVRDDVDIGAIPKVVREFAVQKSSSSSNEAPPRPASGTTSGGGRVRPNKPFLMHITAEGEEYALPLDWICTIGRQDGNDVKVNDQRASKRHAEIFYNDGTYFLRDLNSANGTLLNGEYVVEDIALKHDDEVVIGRTMILFQTPEVVPRPAGPAPSEAASDEATVVPLPSESEPVVATERPSENEDPSPIRVVRGQPEPARGRGRVVDPMPTPAEDLFAEAPTRGAAEPEDLFAAPSTQKGGGEDLFVDAAPEASTDDALFTPPSSKKPTEDLFAADRSRDRDQDDLFADTKKRAPAEADLFAPKPQSPNDDELFADTKLRTSAPLSPRPSSRAKTQVNDGLGIPPRIDSSARLVAELTNEPVATDVLEELQPLPPEALGSPIDEVAPLSPGSWEERTPTDAALQNRSVEGLDEAQNDEATMMSSRQAVFGQASPSDHPPSEELPRWGEASRPVASVEADPDLGLGLPLYGEDLPEAAISLVELKPLRPDEDDGLPPDAETFQRTLAALRRATERADLPDRAQVLEAIELLETHPYVRVALKALG